MSSYDYLYGNKDIDVNRNRRSGKGIMDNLIKQKEKEEEEK